MTATCTLLLLLLTCLGARAQGATPVSLPKEPTGGLLKIAVQPSELHPQAWRCVRLLLDSDAKPPTQVLDLPARPRTEAPDADPVQPFRREMDRVDAEAVV